MKDKIKFKTILYTFIFLSIFNSCYSKVSNFNFNAKNISNYFSGVVSFDNYNYQNSRSFFRQLDNFENENISYSSKFLQSLINLGRYPDALRYSKKLENKNKSVFESNIFLALHEFKRKNYIKANYYFVKIKIDPRKLEYLFFKNLYVISFLTSKSKRNIFINIKTCLQRKIPT